MSGALGGEAQGAGSGGRRVWLALALCVLGVFWSGYSWVRATNFGGHDEWLLLWMNAKGVFSIPYANRPLVLFWSRPVALLFGNDLAGYWLLHGLYLSATGLATLGIVRVLVPSSPRLAFLAASFAVAWAPLDSTRLDAVLMTGFSGNTLGTFVALLVALESWRRASPALLGTACLLAVVAARGNEASIPLLAAAPAGFVLLARRPSLRLLAWVAAWSAVVAAAGLFALWPVMWPVAGSYQASALGFDPHPLRAAGRILRQFGFHLLPLGSTPPTLMLHPAVALALASFAVAGALAPRAMRETPAVELRDLVVALLGGAGAALLAYLPYALTPSVTTPARTQIFSAPGIGLFLAAAFSLLVRPLSPRWRLAALGILGGWVVAAGTARTLALQREWDLTSFWPAQSRTLRELTRLAPDLRPNTFVLLLDETDTWRATFTFRHAVDYVYEGRAIGAVWGAHPFLYPFALTGRGLFAEPWPVIQGPWGVRPSFHRHDDVVVARLAASGLEILARWPDGVLPPLPEGAIYDPEGRIVRGGPTPAVRRILGAYVAPE